MSTNDFEPRELHPETAELLGVEPATSPETKMQGTFETDLEAFSNSIAAWEQQFGQRVLPTVNDVPEGYRWYTNTGRSPYDRYLNRDIELQNRGAPLLFCGEATDSAGRPMNEDVAIYIDGQMDYNLTSPIIRLRSPQDAFTHLIDTEQIHYRDFDDNGRIIIGEPAKTFDTGILWAKAHGLVEAAFMTCSLLRYTNPIYRQRVNEDTFIRQAWERDKKLYDKFAAELDNNGNRKFHPLSIEQFALLALAPLVELVRRDPSLNERLQLTRPFPVQPDNGDSYA